VQVRNAVSTGQWRYVESRGEPAKIDPSPQPSGGGEPVTRGARHFRATNRALIAAHPWGLCGASPHSFDCCPPLEGSAGWRHTALIAVHPPRTGSAGYPRTALIAVHPRTGSAGDRHTALIAAHPRTGSAGYPHTALIAAHPRTGSAGDRHTALIAAHPPRPPLCKGGKGGGCGSSFSEAGLIISSWRRPWARSCASIPSRA
jgi:hypothetical protein